MLPQFPQLSFLREVRSGAVALRIGGIVGRDRDVGTLKIEIKLVEAAGVEPASENVTGQETTCLVRFLPQALPWDVRGPRSERTRNAFR